MSVGLAGRGDVSVRQPLWMWKYVMWVKWYTVHCISPHQLWQSVWHWQWLNQSPLLSVSAYIPRPCLWIWGPLSVGWLVDAAWSCDFPRGWANLPPVCLCCVSPSCYPTPIYIKALMQCSPSTSRPSFTPAGFHDEISEQDWWEITCCIRSFNLISMIQSSNLDLNWFFSAGISCRACSCGSMSRLCGLEHLTGEG